MSADTGSEVPLRPDAMSIEAARMAMQIRAGRTQTNHPVSTSTPILRWLRRLRTIPKTIAAHSRMPSRTVRLL